MTKRLNKVLEPFWLLRISGATMALLWLTGCPLVIKEPVNHSPISPIELIVLGNVQDAGSPHIGCNKSCCAKLFKKRNTKRKVVCLGVVDHFHKTSYLFEATPDITTQVKLLSEQDTALPTLPTGIFLTHAHIGHYAGLMYLGKEAINAYCAPVYAMQRMQDYLENHGPWSQLVDQHNIEIKPIQHLQPVKMNDNLTVTPFKVPHRDEFSETVGYTITGRDKSALFIPDIDKWEKWDSSIVAAISVVDYAFVDATFYDGDEINTRDISEIPHPFVVETMAKLNHLSKEEKAKVYFIHMNHTNPLLDPASSQSKDVLKAGFNIARLGDSFSL